MHTVTIVNNIIIIKIIIIQNNNNNDNNDNNNDGSCLRAERAVVGAIVTVLKGPWKKRIKELVVEDKIETKQTTALLGSAIIFRRVPKTWIDLLSLRTQKKITG